MIFGEIKYGRDINYFPFQEQKVWKISREENIERGGRDGNYVVDQRVKGTIIWSDVLVQVLVHIFKLATDFMSSIPYFICLGSINNRC